MSERIRTSRGQRYRYRESEIDWGALFFYLAILVIMLLIAGFVWGPVNDWYNHR